MIYALDANTLIYGFKEMGQVKWHVEQLSPPELAIPAPVLYELEYGVALSNSPAKRRKQIDLLLQTVAVLPFDAEAAARAAQIAAHLKKAGRPVGPIDTLIAGTVLAHHATLVTHNTREFQRIPGLQIVDWY